MADGSIGFCVMKTVVFIDKSNAELWESYLRYDFLLDEYSSAGAYEVCNWKSDADSVHGAIPELEDLIGDEEHWKAVIVCDLRDKGLAPQDDRHFDNPYDYPETYEVRAGDPLVESERPIVRLSQMLGGLPEKAAIDWPDWQREGLGNQRIEDVREQNRPQFGEFSEEVFNGSLDGGPSEINLNEISIAMPHDPDRYGLLERYRLGVARPQTILCITPRYVDEDLTKEREGDLESARRGHEEELAELVEQAHIRELTHEEQKTLDGEIELDFWQRNSYPASVRLIVNDWVAPALSQKGNSPDEDKDPLSAASKNRINKRDNWFQFWLSVLSLAVAELPNTCLRPYKLHSIHVDFDESKLNQVFSRRLSEWTAAREAIATELDQEDKKLETSEFITKKLPDCTSSFSVTFDLVDEEGLHADPSVVGLFKDSPEPDVKEWKRQYRTILDGSRMLLRAPLRGLSIAAAMYRQNNALDEKELEYCALNKYQTECLADDLRGIEYSLAEDTKPASFEIETYMGSISDSSKSILETIGKRSSKGQSAVAILTACAALIVGFLPYCLGLLGGIAASAAAWLVTFLVCGILLVVAFLTLLRMKAEVKESYRSFNGVIARMLSSLHSEGGRLGKRLSSIATFKKKWSILERQRKLHEPTSKTISLGRKSALLKTRINDILKVAPDSSVNYDIYHKFIIDGWEKIKDRLDTESFYSIYDINESKGHLNKNQPSEQLIKTPYSFIPNIDIEIQNVS